MPCTEVTVSENDESELVLEDINHTSPSVETIAVSYTVRNNVLSGDGERLSATVETTVDGSVVDSQSFEPRVDDASVASFSVDASPGDHEVCSDFV